MLWESYDVTSYCHGNSNSGTNCSVKNTHRVAKNKTRKVRDRRRNIEEEISMKTKKGTEIKNTGR